MTRSSSWKKHRSYLAVLLVVAGWLAIQWPHHSLWYDETLTTWVAGGSWERLIRWCTQVDIQVPLHYVVLRGWMAVFGSSEFALHLLSAFCGLLAVAGLMALARRLTGPTAGVIAGLLLGLSPGFLWVAYEVRAYALALALFAWASVLLVHLLDSPSPRRWAIVGYAALMLGTLYTHYTGLGALAAHVVIVLWVAFRRRDSQLLRRLMAPGLIIAVGFAPWLPVLFSRGSADRSYYAGSILPDQTLGVILSFKWLARDDFRWVMPDGKFSPLVPFVAGGLILLLVGIAAWLARGCDRRALIYGLCLAILPYVMIAAVVYFKPKLAGRYDWPSWIGLDLLLALGPVALVDKRFQTSPPAPLQTMERGDLSTAQTSRTRFLGLALILSALGHPSRERGRIQNAISPRSIVWSGGQGMRSERLIALMSALLLIATPWLSGQIGHPPNSDFRGVFAYIREHWQPGDQVILRDGTLFPAAEYYHSPNYLPLPAADLTDATHVLHAAEAVPILKQQSDSIRGVWVVSWQGDVMDPEAVIPGLLESLGARQPIQTAFGDVSLEYYALNRPLSTLETPQVSGQPIAVMPDGLTLVSAQLVPDLSLAHPGDDLIGHTWWLRQGPVSSNARVSIRLYGEGGHIYGQIDQPPAGWVYFPDRWPDNTLILGRYVMRIPEDATGPLTMKLVIYSAANDVKPVEAAVGTVEVQPAAAPGG